MCISKPKVPAVRTPATMQPAKLPDEGSTAAETDLTSARRRALMATVMTTPNGVIGAPSTTSAGYLG